MVIGDRDTVTGFRLAGIEGTQVGENANEIRDFIQRSLDRDVGIVIITRSRADMVREYLDRVRRERALVKPVFVEIPDKGGSPEEGRLEHLIKRVLGTEVSLESIG